MGVTDSTGNARGKYEKYQKVKKINRCWKKFVQYSTHLTCNICSLTCMNAQLGVGDVLFEKKSNFNLCEDLTVVSKKYVPFSNVLSEKKVMIIYNQKIYEGEKRMTRGKKV